jgi:hypothetical protein
MLGSHVAATKTITTQILTARFLSANPDGTMRVDFGAGPVSVVAAGVYWPVPGEPVRVLRVGSVSLLVGPAVPKPTFGVVATIAATSVTVDFGGGDMEDIGFLDGYTPTVGDQVVIHRGSVATVLGKLAQTPAPPPDDVTNPEPTAPERRTVTFNPTAAGTQNTGSSSFWTGDVWCGSTTTGAWFYGDSIDRTIPDGATIISGRIYVVEFFNQFPSSLATIGTHTSKTKSGVLSVTGAQTISRGTGWKTLPADFLTRLKTGSAYGIATNHGGYHKFRGLDSSSGRLEITFES